MMIWGKCGLSGHLPVFEEYVEGRRVERILDSNAEQFIFVEKHPSDFSSRYSQMRKIDRDSAVIGGFFNLVGVVKINGKEGQ